MSTADCTIPQKPMLARPTIRQELSAALRPDSSGLFTPPAEPFLPPVDTTAHTPVPPPRTSPPAASSLSLAMLTDRLEFRSLDEPDEISLDRSRPLLQSHVSTTARLSRSMSLAVLEPQSPTRSQLHLRTTAPATSSSVSLAMLTDRLKLKSPTKFSLDRSTPVLPSRERVAIASHTSPFVSLAMLNNRLGNRDQVIADEDFLEPSRPLLRSHVSTANLSTIPPSQTSPFPPLATSTDKLESRILNESNEMSLEPSRPLLNSQMLSKSLPARALASLEAEERERASKFQQLKALEYESVSTHSNPPLLTTSSTEMVEKIAPRTENVSMSSAPAVLEHVPTICEDPVVEDADSLEPEDLPPLIHEPSPPHTAPAPQIIELTLDTEPPPLITCPANLNEHSNSLQISNSMPVKRTRRFVARPSLQTSSSTSTKQQTTRTSRGQSRETSRGRAPSKQAALFPENLNAVDRPREAMQQCLQQMDSADWEVTMQGLQTLVRLLRHHPEVPQAHLHSVAASLGKQVRNLRSQVSRAACQASGEVFQALRRSVESELEELVAPLFHRAADTNKFLRADCNAALDKMVEAVTPARAVAVIVAKGANHQNAVVRTAAARLLLSIVTKLGPDRVMMSAKETRDKVLLTGANLLMEGSLDTRCYAKQLFRCLATHSNFLSILTEVLPPTVLRNINKTLQSLK